jgi:acetyl-CoA carboxylase biotin carboxyl carrier protein
MSLFREYKMDKKQIEELLNMMEKRGLKRLHIKQADGFEVELEKESHSSPKNSFCQEGYRGSQEEKRETELKGRVDKTINAPIVGTFYVAASPSDSPFVKVGDYVKEETVVCIVEAMKVMNEVKAGIKGQIVETLLDNACPVEFGTPLFRVV